MPAETEHSRLERKIDHLTQLVTLFLPPTLPEGEYEARLIGIDERVSRAQRKYWRYCYEFMLIPGRTVFGYYQSDRDRPSTEVGAIFKVDLIVSVYNEKPYNRIIEVRNA